MAAPASDRTPLPQWAGLFGSRLIDLLGWRLIDARPDEGWIRAGFNGKEEFCAAGVPKLKRAHVCGRIRVTFAAWMNRVLRYLLPRLDMRPRIDRPHLLYWRGALHRNRIHARMPRRHLWRRPRPSRPAGRCHFADVRADRGQGRCGGIKGAAPPGAADYPRGRGKQPVHPVRGRGAELCQRR